MDRWIELLIFVKLLIFGSQQPAQCVLQRPPAIPPSTRVALWSRTTFGAAAAMHLATPLARSGGQDEMMTRLPLHIRP